jgi:phosphoribosylaminoimidazole-succinocarboxamide synthase
MVLNRISEWAFEATKDIIPNALWKAGADPSCVIQKKMKNLQVECIVRGYMWGSMAGAYERGERTFCGLELKDDLIRFEKFPEPIFTPTTKAEMGDHDENMTMGEVAALVGEEMAQKAKETALKLYARGNELMRKNGMILIDTKYEFGLDENGVLHVIDEVNTPDSSRMCEITEWESKYPKIEAEMKTGHYKTVSELLKAKPELKIKEYSKQYVRDALLDMGFNPAKDLKAPRLTEDQVVECAYRYINICEKITGEEFVFPNINVPIRERVLRNLKDNGIIKGACAFIFAGSDSDAPHIEKLQNELTKLGVPNRVRICSAHKQPAQLQAALEQMNDSMEPCCIIACAGGTDALSGTASFHSVFPVVSCPPDGMNQTCLTNPPGSSNSFIKSPGNCARHVAQIFSSHIVAIKTTYFFNLKNHSKHDFQFHVVDYFVDC